MRLLGDEIKIGEQLIDIINKIDKSKNTVDEAISLYSNVMNDVCDQYKGKTSDNLSLFKNSELIQLQKLSSMYEKASYFVMYSLKQMNYIDNKLANTYNEEIQIGDGK